MDAIAYITITRVSSHTVCYTVYRENCYESNGMLFIVYILHMYGLTTLVHVHRALLYRTVCCIVLYCTVLY